MKHLESKTKFNKSDFLPENKCTFAEINDIGDQEIHSL